MFSSTSLPKPSLFTRFLSWLTPIACLSCRKWLSDSHKSGSPYFCPSCWQALPWQPHINPSIPFNSIKKDAPIEVVPHPTPSLPAYATNKPNAGFGALNSGLSFSLVGNAPALNQPHLNAIQRIYAPFQYLPPLQHWIWKLKYQKQQQLVNSLCLGLLHEAIKHQLWSQVDYVMPVPLHKNRLRMRGFNQAQLLAHAWWRQMKKHHPAPHPLLADRWLVRMRYTPSQTQFNAQQRLRNVENAFALITPHKKIETSHFLEGKRVLLVDDVVTTGATLSACAALCKAHGASQVDALVLAQVPFR